MTELEAHARADQIVRHMLDDPLQLRSFVAACLLADAHIAAQDATIALLRAEVRARRELWGCLEMLNGVHNLPAFKSVVAARAATDAAKALEEQ